MHDLFPEIVAVNPPQNSALSLAAESEGENWAETFSARRTIISVTICSGSLIQIRTDSQSFAAMGVFCFLSRFQLKFYPDTKEKSLPFFMAVFPSDSLSFHVF